MNKSNVIIIGAPRSGTNMLRDILTCFDGIGTWPCDEINYIWRHKNVRYPSDEIPRARATEDVQRYIQKKFESLRRKHDYDIIVEKTCANSLRVPFVDAVIPDAKYIFIYRDGIDAAGSAKLRWKAKLNLQYVLEKVRFVPTSDLPYYAFRYFWSRAYRLFSKEKRLAFWGPALNNMQTLLKEKSLNEVCVLQWKRCVDNAEKAFKDIPEDRVIRVKYENLVCSPKNDVQRILKFIGRDVCDHKVNEAVAKVTSNSIGKGRMALGIDETKELDMMVKDTLQRLGYL